MSETNNDNVENNIKEKIAYNMVQNATTEISESWFNKYNCGCE